MSTFSQKSRLFSQSLSQVITLARLIIGSFALPASRALRPRGVFGHANSKALVRLTALFLPRPNAHALMYNLINGLLNAMRPSILSRSLHAGCRINIWTIFVYSLCENASQGWMKYTALLSEQNAAKQTRGSLF
jgi:hypothetical protein